MNAPHLPVVRYRTAKLRDQGLRSLGQSDAPTARRTTLTLGPLVSGRNFPHGLASKESTSGAVATIRTVRLKGPAAVIQRCRLRMVDRGNNIR
jgi:hypothetical protein